MALAAAAQSVRFIRPGSTEYGAAKARVSLLHNELGLMRGGLGVATKRHDLGELLVEPHQPNGNTLLTKRDGGTTRKETQERQRTAGGLRPETSSTGRGQLKATGRREAANFHLTIVCINSERDALMLALDPS